jgi:glutamate transport system substrate-binding protein
MPASRSSISPGRTSSPARTILVYKVDADSIKSVTDLNGKKVCTVQGSTSLRNLQAQAARANVTALNTYSECVESLKDGRVDAVTTDDSILIAFAKQFPAFALVGKPFSDEPYGIGLKRCDNDFRSYLNDLLEKSYTNGDYKKAWDLTLGDAGLPLKETPKVDRYKNC